MKEITEEEKVHEDWYKEADSKEMTLEKLPAFLDKLTGEYHHDYGTICHAITAGAIATMWAINRAPGARGGITGFQANCIMWEFIKRWMNFKGPMRLIQYDDMLYPQMAYKFEKTINKATWENLQKKASEFLNDGLGGTEEVRAHWQSIVDSQVPFGFTIKEG